MTRTSVRVRGATETRRALEGAADDLASLRDQDEKAGRLLLDRARSRAPRRSGALAASHVLDVERSGAFVTAGEDLEYAAVIHWGWPAHNIEPQPWLTETADDQRDALVDVYEHEVERVVHEVDRRA